MGEAPKTYAAAIEKERALEEALDKAHARRQLTRIENRLATLKNLDAALQLIIRSVEDLIGQKADGLAEAVSLLRTSGAQLRERADGVDSELVKLEDAELERRARSCRLKQRELENARRAHERARQERLILAITARTRA